MPALWFAIITAMLATYTVLDGFDFGAGMMHLFVAKTDAERRTVLAAIGPFWDGNEVWLIATGGVFVFAFPRAYAAALSGLYLPLMIVLWLLVLRGLSIALRSELESPLWRAAFDVIFASSSATMAIVLGIALGNVIRGVPLDGSGYFHEDLFGGGVGAVDIYTATTGVFALVALAAHGATFLAWKTQGPLQVRCATWAVRGYRALMPLVFIATALTAHDAPGLLGTFARRPWLWPLPVAGVGAGLGVLRWLARGRWLRAFLASCAFLASFLLATSGALFPTILRSTIDPAFTIDASSASGDHALGAGLAFWVVAAALAVSYFVYLFRQFRGKASSDSGHG
jgi:cytochrome bd ubiquinol oxidase subunit II